MWRHETKHDILISRRFRTPKMCFYLFILFYLFFFFFFNISLGAQLAYKIYSIKFYREWPNLNTVKISFCKMAVPLVKFMIKDLKMTEKIKAVLSYPYLAPSTTREEGQHKKISVDPENRSSTHKHCAMTLLFTDFDFFLDLQGRFVWFENLLL